MTMKFIASRVSLFYWIGIVTASSECILERNQYNEYPWLIKIYLNRTWGHGALTAPGRVISAYDPFKSAFESNWSKLHHQLKFIAHIRGAGTMSCTAVRKSKELYRSIGTVRNIAYWEMERNFEVGVHFPFLFDRVEEIEKNKIEEALANTKLGEQCYVPLFKEEMSINTEKINVDEVSLADFNECKTRFDKSSRITAEEFCVLQHYHAWHHYTWLEGAVILCRNKPLGLISEVGHKNTEARGYTVFLSLAYSADVLSEQAKILWPTKSTTASIATTVMTTNRNTFETNSDKNPETTPGTIIVTTDEPTGKEVTRAKDVTYMTSKIPLAPVMTHPPPTTEYTGMFVGTPPIRALYITRPNSVSPRNDSRLLRFTICIIALQRLCMKYIL